MKDSGATCEDRGAMRCTAAGLLVPLAAIPWIGAPRVALADPACSTVDVQEDPRVRARWPRLSELIHEAFEGRDDIDACARIELKTSAATTVNMTVVLPDGRSASRSAQGDDVLPTLEALLLVPQSDWIVTAAPAAAPQGVPSTGSSPPAEGDPLPIPLGSKVASRDVAPGPARLPASPSSPLRIELSVATNARVGSGQTGLGLGAVSLLEVGQWLAGFEGQVERYRQLGGGPPGGALEFGALVGRRFRFGNMAVDLLAGPAVALRGRIEITTASPVAKTTTPSNEELVPRALFCPRVVFAAHSILRGFVGLEGELGPGSAPSEQRLGEAPGLPIWTVGLALGATVGTP